MYWIVGGDLTILLIYSVKLTNTMKVNKLLPKHRQLTLKAVDLLLNGKTKEANKFLKEARKEMNKFYNEPTK
jgi:hypothetical protein